MTLSVTENVKWSQGRIYL